MKTLRFEWEMAIRFLREGRGQTILIIAGVGIGVTVLVFLNTLIDGLQRTLIQKTVGKFPHITITRERFDTGGALRANRDGTLLAVQENAVNATRGILDWRLIKENLEKDSRIKAVLPVVQGSAFLARGGANKPVVIRGMDMTDADRIYKIRSGIQEGTGDTIAGTVLLGKQLAEDLDVRTGDAVSLLLENGNSARLLVGGIFDLGVQTPNRTWVVMNREQAGRILGLENQASFIESQVNDVLTAGETAREWRGRLPGYRVESWQETNSELLSGLRGQSSSSYMIQVFVLLAVSLGISSVLVVSVMQKSKDIGILKAMGMRSDSIARVFLMQGAAMGLIGALIGCVLGAALIKLYLAINAVTGGILFPIELQSQTLVFMTLVCTAASTVAAYVPARRSSGINPIEVIRNG